MLVTSFTGLGNYWIFSYPDDHCKNANITLHLNIRPAMGSLIEREALSRGVESIVEKLSLIPHSKMLRLLPFEFKQIIAEHPRNAFGDREVLFNCPSRTDIYDFSNGNPMNWSCSSLVGRVAKTSPKRWISFLSLIAIALGPLSEFSIIIL